MRFLVIGLGSIGMRHAKNLLAMGHEVLGYDVAAAPCQAAHSAGIVLAGGATFNDEKVDACVIATPTPNHRENLEWAADNDLHIFVEKPMAQETDRLADLLRWASPRVVMVGNNLRFRGCTKTVRSWLSGKEPEADIGRPLCARFVLSQYSDKPDYMRDGVISNWGAHELDLATYLLGPAKVVVCAVDRGIADIVLRHENDCQTSIHLDYVGRLEERGFVITGEKGLIDCTIVRNVANVETVMGGFTAGMSASYPDTFDDNYVEEMQAFVSRIEGKEALGATGEEGLEVLKLINEAQRIAV